MEGRALKDRARVRRLKLFVAVFAQWACASRYRLSQRLARIPAPSRLTLLASTGCPARARAPANNQAVQNVLSPDAEERATSGRERERFWSRIRNSCTGAWLPPSRLRS